MRVSTLTKLDMAETVASIKSARDLGYALADFVDVLDYRGRSLRRIPAADLVEVTPQPGESSPKPPAVSPTAVCVDAQDRVYIGLSGSVALVAVLDDDGRLVRRIGQRGTEPGQFTGITGLWVDKQGRMIVTDVSATPVQVFSSEGELLSWFGKHEVGWANFSLPSGAVRDGAGRIWVADPIRQVVKSFDDKGNFLAAIGGLGTGPGEMRYPVSVSGDGDRLLVVLERAGARFQVFEVTS